MSAEQNRAIVQRLIEEMINQRNLDIIDELVSPDFVEHEEMPPGAPEGRDAPRAAFGMMHEAFPDLQAAIEHIIADDDMVAVHMTWTGTHEGDFMGIPATGNAFTMPVVDIFKIVDGQFVDHWGVTDMGKMMQQLGVSPE